MEKQDIEKLLEKYYEGLSSLEEERILKDYFAGEHKELEPVREAEQSWFHYVKEQQQENKLDSEFDQELFSKLKEKGKIIQIPLHRIIQFSIGIAAALLLFFTGMYLGNKETEVVQASSKEISELKSEINELKDQVMISQLQKTNASERIKGVNTVTEVKPDNDAVVDALINTLNTDESPNVRISAANALFIYKDSEKVRQALIEGIQKQEDTSVKIALINLMIAMKEKKAKPVIEEFLLKEQVPAKVRVIINDELKKI